MQERIHANLAVKLLPSSHPGLRVATVAVAVVILLVVVVTTFWYQDVRYSLPTPRPPSLKAVALNSAVPPPAGLPLSDRDERPLLLHFFNPDCPCSVFNAEHVRALRARYGRAVRFLAVVQTSEGHDATWKRSAEASVRRLFGPDMDGIVDESGRIAATYGVYSTPQAVILSDSIAPVLLFRGNYNASRYCVDPQSEFVRQALDALTSHRPLPLESRAAMLAYGCELPANTTAAKPLLVPPRS